MRRFRGFRVTPACYDSHVKALQRAGVGGGGGGEGSDGGGGGGGDCGCGDVDGEGFGLWWRLFVCRFIDIPATG